MDFSKLQWACRRGMLELDILLGRYLQAGYLKASPEERQAFQALLGCEDQSLYHWLCARQVAPSEHQMIVAKILQVNQAGVME